MAWIYGDTYGKLPIFPAIYGPVTEERIERLAERLMDVGDAVLMRGEATQAQYDAWVKQLDAYTKTLYKDLRG